MSQDLIIPFIQRPILNRLKPPGLTVSRVQKENKIDPEEPQDRYFEHRLPVRKRQQSEQKEQDDKDHHIDILV